MPSVPQAPRLDRPAVRLLPVGGHGRRLHRCAAAVELARARRDVLTLPPHLAHGTSNTPSPLSVLPLCQPLLVAAIGDHGTRARISSNILNSSVTDLLTSMLACGFECAALREDVVEASDHRLPDGPPPADHVIHGGEPRLRQPGLHVVRVLLRGAVGAVHPRAVCEFLLQVLRQKGAEGMK